MNKIGISEERDACCPINIDAEILFGNSFVPEDKLEYRIVVKERNTYGEVIWDSGLITVKYGE